MGTLITFYSYKGGVGRTMALANIATLLAKWGKRVLLVDWDLEAPGIEHFFFNSTELRQIHQRKGLIDLFNELSELNESNVPKHVWSDLLVEVILPNIDNSVHLLTAGARSQGYFRNVRKLDVKSFYEEINGTSLKAFGTVGRQNSILFLSIAGQESRILVLYAQFNCLTYLLSYSQLQNRVWLAPLMWHSEPL